MSLLAKENVLLNQDYSSKEAAIRATGEFLVAREHVSQPYIEKMLERDALTSVFIGNLVAIPHGTEDSQGLIRHSGIVVIQVPEGVDFDGNLVKVLVGIAGVGDEHLDLLATIAITCSELANVEQIVAATTVEEIIDLFEMGEV